MAELFIIIREARCSHNNSNTINSTGSNWATSRCGWDCPWNGLHQIGQGRQHPGQRYQRFSSIGIIFIHVVTVYVLKTHKFYEYTRASYYTPECYCYCQGCPWKKNFFKKNDDPKFLMQYFDITYLHLQCCIIVEIRIYFIQYITRINCILWKPFNHSLPVSSRYIYFDVVFLLGFFFVFVFFFFACDPKMHKINIYIFSSVRSFHIPCNVRESFWTFGLVKTRLGSFEHSKRSGSRPARV